MFGRSNVGPALTRKANKAIKGRVSGVAVKCGGYTNMQGGVVDAPELEKLMSARQILTEAGIFCSAIQTQYKNLGPLFYISFAKEGVEL